MRHTRAVIAIVAAIVLSAAACSGDTNTAAPKSSATAQDCPSSPMPANPAGGAGGGPPASAAKPQIVVPVDTTTSTLLKPGTAPQIQCGRTPISTNTDVVYSTVQLSDGRVKQLAMDIQVPQTPDTKPLIVYVPGGGFVMADKGGNLSAYLRR